MIVATSRAKLEDLRRRANTSLRQSVGLAKDPPARCENPREAYGVVNGVARVVHGDLPSMLVGGLGSLFFQMLHPYAMTGVAQHSRYQDDPLARLLSTANFIGATTFGSKDSAQLAIDRVTRVHDFVHGVADDGVRYDAHDPHLLLWVHCSELYMFLNAYRRFGARHLSSAEADAYVAEMVRVALDVGVTCPPSNVEELNATLESFRSELRLIPEGAIARDFIAHGVASTMRQRFVHRLLVLSAWSLLPPWARDVLGVRFHAVLDRLVLRPATRTLAVLGRLAVPPPRQVTIDSPPSTTTT